MILSGIPLLPYIPLFSRPLSVPVRKIKSRVDLAKWVYTQFKVKDPSIVVCMVVLDKSIIDELFAKLEQSKCVQLNVRMLRENPNFRLAFWCAEDAPLEIEAVSLGDLMFDQELTSCDVIRFEREGSIKLY